MKITIQFAFEMLTWGQLGLHQKPAGLLNINAFFTSLPDFLDQLQSAGFLKQPNRNMLLEAGVLLKKMTAYQPLKVKK